MDGRTDKRLCKPQGESLALNFNFVNSETKGLDLRGQTSGAPLYIWGISSRVISLYLTRQNKQQELYNIASLTRFSSNKLLWQPSACRTNNSSFSIFLYVCPFTLQSEESQGYNEPFVLLQQLTFIILWLPVSDIIILFNESNITPFG